MVRLTAWALLERTEPIPVEVDARRAKLEAISEAQALGTMTTAVRALTQPAGGAASAECRRSEDSVGRCCGRIYRLKVAIHWREHY